MIHELKLNSKYYYDSLTNVKTFEICKNYRNFKVGDILKLVETIQLKENGRKYVVGTRPHYKQITYILDDQEYLQEGYVCLGLQPVPEPKEEQKCY